MNAFELTGKKIVVTGGGGFLGKALCVNLINQGASVYSISRSYYPELANIGVKVICADLASKSPELENACNGAWAIFHTAAKVDMWGAYSDFYNTNYIGTKNILAACQQSKVPYFIYTSSPSVVANGMDLKNVDETTPYPKHYKANYPKTKALAEQLVLKSASENLKTCALRPHLIWGPGDTNLIPTVLERAKLGKLVKIGGGQNLVDFTYIDDCVKAHLMALAALQHNRAASGLAYFISQGDPMNLWDWINRILEIHNMPAVTKRVNKHFAYLIASLAEMMAKIMPGSSQPLLTRFLVEEMATDHYFDISRAKKLLGFTPSYTMDQALDHYSASTTVLAKPINW